MTTLCSFLDRERFDVEVLCLNHLGPFADELKAQGILVHLLEGGGTGPDYFAFWKVAAFLRSGNFDVVHTHNTQPFIDGGLGAKLAGVPTLVHTDHARDFPDRLRYMVAEYMLSHLAYKVVGVSEDTTAKLRSYEHIPARKLLTIPNGIDGRPFDRRIDRRVKRSELGLSADAPVMVFAGRLTPQKGLTYLLEAMVGLTRRFQGLTLLVAGDGASGDELWKKAEDLGLLSSVRFLGVRSDVPEILMAGDLFVLPSVWEGLPMVLLEALAAGCPVVASAVGGVPTVIRHTENGLLVKARDVVDLEDQLGYVLSDEGLRSRIASAGRSAFEDHFSADRMARSYEALYSRSQ